MGPPRIVFSNGEAYRLVVMRVEGTYDDRPKHRDKEIPAELLFLDDNDVTEVTEGARYITAYVPEVVFGKKPTGA